MQLGTVTLVPPWQGHLAPTFDMKSVKPDAYFQALFSHVAAELFTLFTENIGWMIFGLSVMMAPVIIKAILHHYHPGDPYGRGRDAQYAAEIAETHD